MKRGLPETRVWIIRICIFVFEIIIIINYKNVVQKRKLTIYNKNFVIKGGKAVN